MSSISFLDALVGDFAICGTGEGANKDDGLSRLPSRSIGWLIR